MIELTDVTRCFGRGARATEALRGVSLRVAPGTTCAFVGPNGAGKTTLFAVVLGFLHADAGDVSIDGAEPRAWVRTHGAGFLPERFSPPDRWRVRETLVALARLDGSRQAALGRADDALDRFGLGGFAARRIASLSRGQLQRFGLAQALCAPHRLVVLDEPTHGLDLEGRAALRAALATLRSEGVTVLMASHDLAEVERVADRVILMADGSVRDPDFTAPREPVRFRIRIRAPATLVQEVFPGARPVEPAREPADTMAADYAVEVNDAPALSEHVARIIAAGGLVLAVVPDTPLEKRVAEALRSDDAQAEAPGPGSSR